MECHPFLSLSNLNKDLEELFYIDIFGFLTKFFDYNTALRLDYVGPGFSRVTHPPTNTHTHTNGKSSTTLFLTSLGNKVVMIHSNAHLD